MRSDAGNAAEKGNVIESLGAMDDVGGLQRRLPGFDSSRIQMFFFYCEVIYGACLENCVVQRLLVIIITGGDPNRAIYEIKPWSNGER